MIPRGYIETWATQRRPGYAAFVWIDGQIYVVYFGATAEAVTVAAREYLERIRH